MIDLTNAVNRTEIPITENPDKVIDIAEENLKVNKQQKVKKRPSDLATRLKVLTSEQMFQRLLLIALAQRQTGNTSEHLLN